MTTTEPGQHTACYRHKNVETAVSCSECGRPICPDCMVFAPVGIHCPECSHQRESRVPRAKPSQTVRQFTRAGTSDLVTRVLVGINVLIYIAQVAESGSLSGVGGQLFLKGALFGPAVADGDWWRIVTAGFLHGSPIHLLFNVLMLWWFGRALEALIGPRRFLALYAISLLAGSAGALLLSPTTPVVGASGAVFGILGAGLLLERRGIYVFGGAAFMIVALNVVISFVIPRISVGGHLGGLVGGVLVMLVMSNFGRSNPAYTRTTAPVVAGLVCIAIASVAIVYLRVRGLA